ncbi:hypothetical protein PFISCL1PPCAC_9137, partial [Pristionchus fissidentatus]
RNTARRTCTPSSNISDMFTESLLLRPESHSCVSVDTNRCRIVTTSSNSANYSTSRSFTRGNREFTVKKSPFPLQSNRKTTHGLMFTCSLFLCVITYFLPGDMCMTYC